MVLMFFRSPPKLFLAPRLDTRISGIRNVVVVCYSHVIFGGCMTNINQFSRTHFKKIRAVNLLAGVYSAMETCPKKNDVPRS